tara:strand:- start:61 stop:735 length:675 start_codon:yes stop_codon:yes gene_type:complete
MLVDEVVIENGDESVFVKTKSMYHEDGNFHYKFDFTLLTEAKGNGSGNDPHEKSYAPLILWHVLHNDHPMSFYVDTLNYTDVGWLKNRFWTNGKAHIYPGQPMTMHLSFRGGNVAMDNQFQLKNIKELQKVKFDMFGEGDDAQIGSLPKDETKYVAVLDENKDLSIKKYDNEHDIIGQHTITKKQIDEFVHLQHFMHFVDQSCMAVHLKHSVPEYFVDALSISN